MAIPDLIDVKTNRMHRKYRRSEQVARILWWLARPVFRLSPRPLFGFRNTMLRLFGARLGKKVHIYPTASIEMPWNLEVGDWSSIGEKAKVYNLGRVTIGRCATVSQGAHLCAGTHDYTRSDLPLLKPPIVVGDYAWICADAFLGPGVRVGDGAIVGARAVVVKDVEPWTVVAGNPARHIKKRELLDAQ